MVVGGAKDEDHMGRWLFQGFQQGIERWGGEHMGFIYDVDLVFSAGRGISHILSELPCLVNSPVGGGVDLVDIDRGAGRNFPTGVALVAGLRGGTLLAVECLGQDAGGGGLSHPADSREEVGVGESVLRDGVLQGADNGLLTDYLLKALGTKLSGKD